MARKNSRTKTWLLGLTLLGVLGLIAIVTVVRSTLTLPEFYREALQVPVEQLTIDGAAFERKIFQLSGDLQLDQPWSVEITEEEINGWLAVDLPEKFPGQLPETISEPRVAFSDGQIHIAFAIDWMEWKSAVHVRGSLFCTEKVNEVGLKISQVSSGWLSIPIEYWVQQIQTSLQKRNVRLTWVESENDPVALLNLSNHMSLPAEGIWIRIDSIEVTDGVIRLQGISNDRGPYRDGAAD